MKAHSIIAIATALFLSATGCMVQAGTGTDDPSASSSEELNAQNQAAVPGAQAQDTPTTKLVQTREGLEEQRVINGVNPNDEQDIELSGGPSGTGNPGDPVQDPGGGGGGGNEPDPHPWHGGFGANAATNAK
jgi:hypothetical protein